MKAIPKKGVCLLLLCLLLLPAVLVLGSCSKEPYELLYSVDVGPITYCVRGSGGLPRRIVLKAGDTVLWSEKISVSRQVGDLGGTYGLEVADLNFDGYQDFLIVTAVDGECRTDRCWLWDPETSDYLLSDDLTGLCNVRADDSLQAIFSFSQTVKTEQAYSDVPAATIRTDRTLKSVWADGKLVPDTAASLTYYSETKRYCYSVSYFDQTSGAFSDPDDQWLTPEKYAQANFDFLYYFR